MKDKKSKSIIFAIAMVTLLILSSVGSLGISTTTVDLDDNVNEVNIVKKTSILSENNRLLTLDASSGDYDNILVAGELEDELYPSMVVNGLNALAAYEYEDDAGTNVYLRTSDNYGKTWSNKIVIISSEFNISSPSVCVKPGRNHAFCTFVSDFNNTGVLYDVELEHFSIDSNKIYAVDWSNVSYNETSGEIYGFWNFSNPDIVYVDDDNYDSVPFITSVIATTNYQDEKYGDASCVNSPMFFYRDTEGREGWYGIAWDSEIENCSNISISMDNPSKTLYGVCEIQDDTNQDILFFNDNPLYWDSDDPAVTLNHQIFTGPENLTHPQIFVKGDQIYIVAETDADGENEIIFYNSSDGGSSWTELIVTENRPPIPDFSYTAERLNVTFTDMSIDTDGYITNWLWDFGDGNTSNEQNPPQQIYENPGSYTVNLTVKDNDNISANISKTINLTNTTPIANFTYDSPQPLAGENVTFNSTSTAYGDNIIENHTWDFGDGSDLVYEEYVNVIHIYAENGTYIAKLTIRDSALNNDSIEKIIRVGLAADFTFDPGVYLPGDTVSFTDLSSVPAGQAIDKWFWDFGDGTNSSAQNPSHSYSSFGTYKVTLTITDNNNTTASTMKHVKVNHRSITPRYPLVTANDAQIYVVFTGASNIFSTISADQGKNWSIPLQLNDHPYSVVEEYRFADIADMNHVVWTDNRDGNKDIYSVLITLPEIDLMIVPGSVNLSTEGIGFIETKNWIEFTVRNNGSQFVEKVPIEIAYGRSGKDPEKTEYQTFLTYLNVGAEKTIEKPLFRFTVIEFINALIDFAGIQNIIVTVDPNDSLGDNDFSNNAYTLTNVTYGVIFPRLAWLEDIL